MNCRMRGWHFMTLYDTTSSPRIIVSFVYKGEVVGCRICVLRMRARAVTNACGLVATPSACANVIRAANSTPTLTEMSRH